MKIKSTGWFCRTLFELDPIKFNHLMILELPIFRLFIFWAVVTFLKLTLYRVTVTDSSLVILIQLS